MSTSIIHHSKQFENIYRWTPQDYQFCRGFRFSALSNDFILSYPDSSLIEVRAASAS